ncbi:MAG: DUF4974 domain-containing protein [Prevotella sp.]|nr:DUF4974 domain-containing protein [Prevotella sp.]
MKEDRLEDLLRAMDHPEENTEEELQQLLSDEDSREYYELAVKAREGFLLRRVSEGRFFRYNKRTVPHGHWYKAAAVIIGVLMLSGITVAAIYIARSPRQQTEISDGSAATESPLATAHASRLQPDSMRTFRDAELEQILNEAAEHYHVSVEYRNEPVRRIRLYTKWDPTAPLDELIERLNGFEKVSIRQDGDLVTVE